MFLFLFSSFFFFMLIKYFGFISLKAAEYTSLFHDKDYLCIDDI